MTYSSLTSKSQPIMRKLFLNLCLIALTLTAHADPYRWLEEDSAATQQWIEEQNALSESYFSSLNAQALEQELCALSGIERWWIPQKQGKTLYFLKRDAGANKATLVRRQGNKTDTLIDPNLFDREVMLVSFSISPNGRHLAYGLSIAGSDQLEWHVLDLETGDDLPEVLTEIQFSKICWDQDNETIYYVRNCQAVLAHKLGTPISEDTLLYQPDEDLILYHPQMVCNGRYILIEERPQVVKRVGIRLIDLLDHSSYQLMAPGDFDVTPVGSIGDEILLITDEKCCMGKLIAINAQKEKRTLIEETSDLLDEAEVVGDKIACSYCADACAQLKIFDRNGRYLYTLPLPNRGSIELDSSDQTLFYSYTDFFTPVQIYSHDVQSTQTEPLYTPHVATSEIVTQQIWYTSKDGTRVPMFLSHKKDLVIDKKTPVLLYGYGGFGIPVTPFFRSYQLKWIESGGVLAVPNIRGGKEFGSKWYDEGRGHNKQNVFDDFIAAAEWLLNNHVGSPKRLGIFGTSNGGLLMGAALTQRPELFGAAVVNKGVLDMLRFHLYTIGRFWICDYGNPDDPADHDYLMRYSPYHNIISGAHYPSTLVNTADHDDRVVPMHSYKFYAALKEANGSSRPILLRLERSCGHGGSDSRDQETTFGRDLLSFFYTELFKAY